METREYNVYKFNELTDDQKELAINNLADVNVGHEWWEYTYEDAANIGLTIDGFDIGRGAYCKGTVCDFVETAEKIIANHGSSCETFLTAIEYMKDRAELVIKYSDGVNTMVVTEDNEYDFDNDCDELDAEFLKSILEDYRIILQKEYEYQTSEQSIIETIEVNDYDFTEDGEID